MDPSFSNAIDKNYSRKTYTAIINGSEETKEDISRKYSVLNMFPTTVAALGANIEGNRLGLGIKLYSDEKTLIKEYEVNECRKIYNRPSAYLKTLSNISISNENLDKIKDNALVDVYADGSGRLYVAMYDIYGINASALQRARIEVINNKNNHSQWFDLTVNPLENNPNNFWCDVHTNVSIFSVEEYNDYMYEWKSNLYLIV